MSAKWPAAFNAVEPKPLKIGILRDIRAGQHEMSEEELERALGAHTETGKYLASMVAGAPRVDRKGNPSSEVSEADAAGQREFSARGWLASR
ncbi:ProQ/FINO family protein [Sinorhizobium fredii]|uniref:ProQ/FINO family protein n=1 Tax=Rhizobium fredii TaxID=380 RepID=UPI0009B71AD3